MEELPQNPVAPTEPTAARPTVSQMREKLGQLKTPLTPLSAREYLACTSLPGGVPRGVICEATGSARTEWTVQLLKQNPALTVFWAEPKLSILPTALHQRGIHLERVLLAETGDKLFPVLRKALKSKLFDCVVLPGAIHEVKILKALQLFARESNACVLFLSKVPKNAWAIPFQLEATWDPGQQAQTQQTQLVARVLKTKFNHEASGSGHA